MYRLADSSLMKDCFEHFVSAVNTYYLGRAKLFCTVPSCPANDLTFACLGCHYRVEMVVRFQLGT